MTSPEEGTESSNWLFTPGKRVLLLKNEIFAQNCLLDPKLYGGPQLSRQIQIHRSKLKIHRGKLKFTTANCKFAMANSNSPRQIQIHHGKFKFATANSNSPRKIQTRHGKFKFTTANLKSLLIALFATGVGLLIGGFGLVLVIRASFGGGLRGLGLLGFGGG